MSNNLELVLIGILIVLITISFLVKIDSINRELSNIDIQLNTIHKNIVKTNLHILDALNGNNLNHH